MWLVNQAGHDYTKLNRWGRVMPMTTDMVNPFAVDRNLLLLSHRVKLAHEDDFIAISGLQILNALVLLLWLRRFPRVNILQWSKRNGDYVHLTLTDEQVTRLATTDLQPAP